MKNFTEYQRYLFVFAHPDDEIYSCITIRNLLRADKEVRLLYVTTGDYAGEAIGRQRLGELARAHETIGVKAESVKMLGISERQLMARAHDAACAIFEAVEAFAPDVIVGHDYEGGHDGHDLVSFCAWQVAQKLSTDFWAFPAYHDFPARRKWNSFARGEAADYELTLGIDDALQKRQLFACHVSQTRYFDDIEKGGYMGLLLSREILRRADGNNYTTMPTHPVGYEFPGSPVTYQSFKNAVIVAHLGYAPRPK